MDKGRENMIERNTEPTRRGPEKLSIIRPYGYSVSKCGYCKGSRSNVIQEHESVSQSNSSSPISTTDASDSSSSKMSLASKSYSVLADSISPSLYEGLINRGWRRSGLHLYKPQNFSSCCPTLTTRLLTRNFEPSKSQRKVLKKMDNILRSQKRPMRGKEQSVTTGKTSAAMIQASMPASISKKQKRNHRQKRKMNSRKTGLSPTEEELFCHPEIYAGNASTSSVSSIEEEVRATGVLQRLEHVTMNALENFLSSALMQKKCLEYTQLQIHERHWKKSYRILSPSKRDRKQLQVRAVSSICAQISGELSSRSSTRGISRELLVEQVVQAIRNSEDPLIAPNSNISNATTTDQSSNCIVSIKSIEAHSQSGQIVCVIQVTTNIPKNDKRTSIQINESENDIRRKEFSSNDYGKSNQKSNNDTNRCKLAHWYERTTGQPLDLEPDGHSITIETLPAHQSALNPDVHRLYAHYQHTIHNDPNPFTYDANNDAEKAKDVSNGEEDEEPMVEIDDPSELDWGEAPTYFTDKISTMLAEYIQSMDAEDCRRAILSNYYSFYQFLVESPFSLPSVCNKQPKIMNGDGRNMQQIPGLPLNKNKDGSAAPLPCGLYHQHYLLGGTFLIAVGVIDILPNGLSSVYLFYHPSFSFELVALGKYTILKEIEFARDILKVPYYYLGYYIESCQKMRYKADYKPTQILCPKFYSWVDAAIAIPKLQMTPRHICPLAEQKPNTDEDGNNFVTKNSTCTTKNDGIVAALNALQMDIGAGMNVTIDMLHPSGVEVVKPIIKEFILEFSPSLSRKCILKLT
mmetsp:Transcript_9486/g.23280  ORF Transcript_9486/g.23280 Transcript_9486/m.23280 type:complete len:803 (-) Transcript_9486:39-2447(-)